MPDPITPAELAELRAKWAEYRAAVARVESGEGDDYLTIAANAGHALDEAIVGGLTRLLDAADERDRLRERLAEVTRDRDALLAACKDAQRYDRSIAGKAARGEVDLLANGGGVVNSDDLDALYLDWSTKVDAAVAGR